jgi:glycosyltransferase involved in cell wall biosynthesis
LIDALHDVLKNNSKIQVYFYGKGHYEKVIRKRIAEFNLTNQIHMKGFVKDVHKLLPSIDIVVHPALKEGLGISLLQASAAGIPIVATRVGGIPECVIDQRNGLVVKQGCSESLKKAIIRLIENPDLRDVLGKNGVEVIKEKFSIPLMVDKYYELYKNLF